MSTLTQTDRYRAPQSGTNISMSDSTIMRGIAIKHQNTECEGQTTECWSARAPHWHIQSSVELV